MIDIPFSDPVVIFALVLFIMLVIPLLLKRLRTPGIIGLIMSGIVIGPHGLNLLEKNSAIDLLSTIGLLYIMFLAGLELELNEFLKRKNRSITFGFLTFSFPILLGFPVCYFFLGFSMNASLLTSIMFATHTLIAYPIVSRLGLAANEAVAITVGGTIITDTTVLIVLSIISGNSHNDNSPLSLLYVLLGIILFFMVVFVVVPRFSRWFFRNHQGEQGAHYLFVMFIVFLLAMLSRMAGVEPIIGAFAAGLVLNRYIPRHSVLLNRISFIGNTLFIPFFLISVGMLVDWAIIFKGLRTLEVAFILSLVAILGKWLAAFVTQRFFRYSTLQRNLIFGLSSSHAAATLAIVMVGFNLKIIDETVLNGTVILILVTCLIASIVTEKSARKLISINTVNDTFLAVHSEKIIISVSNPENVENLIDLALLIKEGNNTLPITLLSVVTDNHESGKKIRENKKMLQPMLDYGISKQAALEITTAIDVNASAGINRLARELDATTLLLGWKGSTGIAQNIFGDIYERIINNFNGQILISRLVAPLHQVDSLDILVPPEFSNEPVFPSCIDTIGRFSEGIRGETTFWACLKDEEKLKEFIENGKVNWRPTIQIIEKPEDFSTQNKALKATNLVIVLTSRTHSLTYHSYVTRLPAYFDESTTNWSFIIIYPPQNEFVSLKTIG